MVFLAIILFLIQGAIFGFAADQIVQNKGYDENWFWWGFFFGFIALLVALSKPDINDWTVTDKETGSERILSDGGWKCNKCGAVNAAYCGTCGCGATKDGNEQSMKQASKHMIEDSAINAMKKYKELLDADIITKEEFDEKKKELLGIY